MNENLELVKNLTKEQRAELLAQLQNEVKNDRMAKRESYEGLRSQFMHDVFSKVEKVESEVSGFKKWLDGETSAFIIDAISSGNGSLASASSVP